MLQSMVCRYDHFSTEWYSRWRPFVAKPEVLPMRKVWEWCAIAQALDERGMLQAGKHGIGFAVGTEPLPSLFAAKGAAVTATDKPGDGGDWASSAQHARELADLHKPELVPDGDFRRLVQFAGADMNSLEGMPAEQYDFVWSSCALEHLGTLKRGMDFVKNAMSLLKPGGVAVHTTEYNCSSNSRTVSQGDNVLYRRRDLDQLGDELRLQRCGLEAIDYNTGTHRHDLDYDEPPYWHPDRLHIKLLIGQFVCTSALLIVQKA